MLVLPAMDGNDPDATLACFAAGPDAVATAVATVRRFAEARRLTADIQMRLAIIAEELVTNIVEHGDAAGRPIELALQRAGSEISVILEDEGTHFDPRDALQPHLPPERGGGAGIALVLAWARISGYDRIGPKNRLSLTLRLDG